MLITIILGALFVLAVTILAVVGLEIVQRVVPAARRQEHNDVAGFIYAVVGVVYAVMLALVVIAVWEDHEAAKDTVNRESNELAEIFWLAHAFPSPEGQRLQRSAESYARVVVEEEWPLMESGESSDRAWNLIDDMRLEIQNADVESAKDQALFEQALQRMEELADARRTRLADIDEGIPRVLWVVLALGGAITVGFTYLFGLDNTRSHQLMVGALAGMIALVLYTIGVLDLPFAGGSQVSPEAFELVIDRFNSSRLRL